MLCLLRMGKFVCNVTSVIGGCVLSLEIRGRGIGGVDGRFKKAVLNDIAAKSSRTCLLGRKRTRLSSHVSNRFK